MQLPSDFVPFSGGLFPPGEGIFLLYQRKRWTIIRGGVRSGSLASANRQHSQRVPLGASGVPRPPLSFIILFNQYGPPLRGLVLLSSQRQRKRCTLSRGQRKRCILSRGGVRFGSLAADNF